MNDWLDRARRAADAPPDRPRVPLLLNAASAAGLIEIGSIEPALGDRLRAAGLALHPQGAGWRVDGDADESLAAIARWLRDAGLCTHWRDELLAVVSAAGERVAAIERGVVRALGITTFAVHLVGVAPDGRVWVQQRAFDKATDPGAWDTLVGGLVAAGESTTTSLAREAMEEAGLAIEQLRDLRATERITVRRPVAEGYMVEHIEVFRADVPEGVTPVNLDGEVERFECLDAAALVERLRRGEFTLEAALILAGELAG